LIERFFRRTGPIHPRSRVLERRGLRSAGAAITAVSCHGITAARYWETGNADSSFRYSNYLSRYHWRHMDLMDILSGFQGRGRASLQDVACLLGLPGKLGMHGSQVWEVFLQGGIKRIRD